MIRNFKSTDLDDIMEIWLKENIATHNFISKSYWMDNFNFVKSAIPESEVYVYEVNREILGFAGIQDNYIEGIFVKEGFKSQGIGKKLLQELKSSRENLVLKVYQKNIKAVRFYERERFIILQEIVEDYTYEKEFIMAWKRDV